MNSVPEPFIVELYTILNVIRHKKFYRVTNYELKRLEDILVKIRDEKIFRILDKVIKQFKTNKVESYLIDIILDNFEGTESTLLEIPVDSVFLNLETNNSRIPRLDYYDVDKEKLLGEAKILKSVFIEEDNNIIKPYYKIYDKVLKILIPENYEMNEYFLQIIADATDSIYIPLNLFIKNFNLLKNKRNYFRYVAVYMEKKLNKDVEKLTINLYNSFKKI